MDSCLMFYHRVDNDDVMETCLASFREVTRENYEPIYFYSDNVKGGEPKRYKFDYGLVWRALRAQRVNGKRQLCKLQCVQELVAESQIGDRIIIADVDLYFLTNPFGAFSDFDIGLTGRPYEYKFPINGGIWFINVNEHTKIILGGYLNEWIEKYKKGETKAYQPGNMDWFIDQDFLIHLWEEKPCNVVDVGWQWNYGPNDDKYGIDDAKQKLKEAYEGDEVKILHLKSKLKSCIYDGWLPNVKISHSESEWNWYANGK